MGEAGNGQGGYFRRDEAAIVKPVLFDNFVECRTRGQKARGALASFKYVIKWLINWKGIRG